MRIRIQLFVSMRIRIRIRIQEAKQRRIQADPDPGQTFKSQKVEFLYLNILIVCNRSKSIHIVQKPFRKEENQVYLSKSAFPIRIRIRDSQMNADLDEPDPDPQNYI